MATTTPIPQAHSPFQVATQALPNIPDSQQSHLLIPENSHQKYIYSMWAIISTFDAFTCLLGLLCVAFVGFNRFSAIPFIIPAFAAMANGLDWYAWSSPYNALPRRAASIAAYIGWTVQEVGSPLYSYFILERILYGRQRLAFVGTFIALSTATFALRFAAVVYLVKQDILGIASKQEKLQPTINKLSLSFYLTAAATESLSAFFLLKTFFAARRTRRDTLRRKVGLFNQLALSTEIRVATLAGVGIIRACVMRPKLTSSAAKAWDVVAVLAENFFCVVLVFDLLATKVVTLEAKISEFMNNGSASDGKAGAGRPGRWMRGDRGEKRDGVHAEGDDRLHRIRGKAMPNHRLGHPKASPASNAVGEITISDEFKEYMSPSIIRPDELSRNDNSGSSVIPCSKADSAIGEKITPVPSTETP